MAEDDATTRTVTYTALRTRVKLDHIVPATSATGYAVACFEDGVAVPMPTRAAERLVVGMVYELALTPQAVVEAQEAQAAEQVSPWRQATPDDPVH